MSATVAWTALVMGLVGGSHCLAMCSAPCAAAEAAGPTPEGLTALEQPIQWTNKKPRSVQPWLRTGVFHGGRIVGYAALGAMAAWAMDSLAWLTQQTMALRPLWTLTHVAILAWGLMMLIQSRQPAWIEQCWRIVGIHAVRFALFGLAGGGTQRRAFAGCLDHGAVCCGQRSLARGWPLGLAVGTAASGFTAG